MPAGIIRREQQRKHEYHSSKACGANQDTGNQCQAYCEFSVGNQECNYSGVGQDKIAQHRDHERISTVGEELVNPELKTSAESELRTEDFVFTKDEK